MIRIGFEMNIAFVCVWLCRVVEQCRRSMHWKIIGFASVLSWGCELFVLPQNCKNTRHTVWIDGIDAVKMFVTWTHQVEDVALSSTRTSSAVVRSSFAESTGRGSCERLCFLEKDSRANFHGETIVRTKMNKALPHCKGKTHRYPGRLSRLFNVCVGQIFKKTKHDLMTSPEKLQFVLNLEGNRRDGLGQTLKEYFNV